MNISTLKGSISYLTHCRKNTNEPKEIATCVLFSLEEIEERITKLEDKMIQFFDHEFEKRKVAEALMIHNSELIPHKEETKKTKTVKNKKTKTC